jgi:hypothetical protein
MVRTVLVFIHVTGAIGVFAAIATAAIGAATTGPRLARLQTTLSDNDGRDPLLSASFIIRGSMVSA